MRHADTNQSNIELVHRLKRMPSLQSFAEILAGRLRRTREELSHAREQIARLQAARAKG